MKRLWTLILAIVSFSAMGQMPSNMSYQAVIRDNNNQLLANTQVGVEITILQGSPSGAVVYVEEHTITTNANGLTSLEIGNGINVSGNLGSIDWANGPYFIETATDPSGGTSYSIIGTTPLLTVPYARHARRAEVADTAIETDPVFGSSVASGITIGDTANWNSKLDSYSETDPVFGNSVAAGITGADTSSWNNKLDSYTETDPIFTAWDKSTGISITESQVSDLGNYIETEADPVFGSSVASGITIGDTASWNSKLDSYSETDPVFGSSVAAGITGADTSAWNNKISVETDPHFNQWAAAWTETDPIFNSSVASNISASDTINWNNKLDSFAETDPVFGSSVANGITGSDTSNWNNKQDELTAGTGIDISGNVVSVTGNTNNQRSNFFIGQDTLGGIVFFVHLDSLGNERGYLLSKTEYTATMVPGGYGSYWDGEANIPASGNGSFLDQWLNSLGPNWYIPALGELTLLAKNHFEIHHAIEKFGLSPLTFGLWSSNRDGTFCYFLDIRGNGMINRRAGAFGLPVRAVKKF